MGGSRGRFGPRDAGSNAQRHARRASLGRMVCHGGSGKPATARFAETSLRGSRLLLAGCAARLLSPDTRLETDDRPLDHPPSGDLCMRWAAPPGRVVPFSASSLFPWNPRTRSTIGLVLLALRRTPALGLAMLARAVGVVAQDVRRSSRAGRSSSRGAHEAQVEPRTAAASVVSASRTALALRRCWLCLRRNRAQLRVDGRTHVSRHANRIARQACCCRARQAVPLRTARRGRTTSLRAGARHAF
jgi:hypothetical protein